MEIFIALQKSPLPNLLVIGGFLLLIIGFIGKINGYIELSQKRQIWAVGLGLLSLGFGIFLFAYNPTPSTSLPVSDLSPIEPKLEIDLGEIKISSLNSNGTQWCADISGKYKVEYISGAYSIYGLDTGCEGPGCWSTAVYVYKNREVEWVPNGGNFGPGNPDFDIGWMDAQLTKQDAEAIARAGKSSFETELKSGECLTFIVTDGKPNYNDNKGEIILGVNIVGQ